MLVDDICYTGLKDSSGDNHFRTNTSGLVTDAAELVTSVYNNLDMMDTFSGFIECHDLPLSV